MQDEFFLFQGRAPVGIRLKYSVGSPDNNNYGGSPYIFPQTDLGNTVGWYLIQQTVEPPTQTDASGPHAPIESAQLPPEGRRYVPGKPHFVTADLVPSFLVFSADRSKLCIVSEPVQAAALRKLLASPHATFYHVTVSGTNYHGLTQKRYDLKTFYDAALQEGASPCQYRDGGISFE